MKGLSIRWTLTVHVAALIGGLLTAPCGFAQTAQVSGVITDSTGAVVPNAGVSALNNDTGVIRATESNSVGYYTVPLLQPGNYMVSVKAVGFTTQVRSGIMLDVGAQQVLNFSMQVGQMTQEIRVTEEAPTVQLGSSELSAVVSSTTVRELPLNGRSWTDLASLQPGVNPITTQPGIGLNGGRGNRGFGAEAAISGARPQQNNYRLDGVSLNDYANGGPGSALGGNLGVDAIQEFSVLTSNYSAEYGKTSGGVVNAITRAGSNGFHGAVYEFLRNSALDAPNFFDTTIPPFKRNQFGAAAGGPIQKDSTFFFVDYEGIRQSLGLTNVSFVPSVAARAGNLCSIPGTPPTCTPSTVTVDPSVQKYLGFYPLPNAGTTGNGDKGVFKFAGQQVTNENYVTARVDRKFSDKDSLFGTYFFDNTPFLGPDPFDSVQLGNLTRRQLLVLEESHTFTPTLVNSARFGFNRTLANTVQTLQALNPLASDSSLGAYPGVDAGQVKITGLTMFQGGLGGQSSSLFRWNSFQGYDDVFLVLGRHSFKFGGAVERMQLNALDLTNPNGLWSFGSLTNFLTNRPKQLTLMIPSTLTGRGTRQTLIGFYAQDDWRWRPNLTLNLGLRYEMTTVPTEVQGKLSNLMNITDSTPHLGDPFFLNPTLHNFEPRVGFAWDPFRNGKTAVRAGFGMFDVLPLPYQVLLLVDRSAPFFELGTVKKLPKGSFFAGAFPLLTQKGLRQSFIEHAPHRNYVMQWNLNIQRELAPNLTGMVGYVGSHGVHQPLRVDDADIVVPTLTSAGYIWPSTPGSATLNPSFGDIRSLTYPGSSSYDALVLQLTKKMSHGFQVQGSYTWGKSIDTSSATLAGDAFTNSISSLPYFDLRLSRGLSDFSIGRTLVINGSWQVPQLKSLSGPAARVVNGWELGGVYTATDGTPFSATFGTDGDPLGLNSSDPWDVPNRLTGSGCATLTNPGNPTAYIKTQCFAVPTVAGLPPAVAALCSTAGQPGQCINLRGNAGRNIIIGPGLSNLDFSIFKNNYFTKISESFNAQFRVEFFNILNRANFSVPTTPTNTDIFDSTGAPTGVAGQLTSTSTTAREIQFALKFVW
jgi:hypothetical protein